MKQRIYKWLPIIFGCHQKKERSFCWRGEPFPICARCTGELIGMLLCPMGMIFFDCSPFFCWILMLPMIVDGSIQLMTRYESNNKKRFITGMFFGYGLMRFFFYTNVWAFEYGRYLAVQIGR